MVRENSPDMMSSWCFQTAVAKMSFISSASSKARSLAGLEAIHHVGDAALLEPLGHCLPTVLDEFGGVTGIDAQFNHAVKAQQ